MGAVEAAKKKALERPVHEIPQVPSNLFFQANEALKPPYSVLVDTNFLSHTVRAKLDLLDSLMDLLYAKCIPIITTCVMVSDILVPRLRGKYTLIVPACCRPNLRSSEPSIESRCG
jgi:hypothetical protein